MKTYWVSWPLERKLNMKFVFKTRSLLRLNWLAESGFPVLRGWAAEDWTLILFCGSMKALRRAWWTHGEMQTEAKGRLPSLQWVERLDSSRSSHSTLSALTCLWETKLSRCPMCPSVVLDFPHAAAHVEPRIQQLLFFFTFKVLCVFSTSWCS